MTSAVARSDAFLATTPALEAKTLFEVLKDRAPERYEKTTGTALGDLAAGGRSRDPASRAQWAVTTA